LLLTEIVILFILGGILTVNNLFKNIFIFIVLLNSLMLFSASDTVTSATKDVIYDEKKEESKNEPDNNKKDKIEEKKEIIKEEGNKKNESKDTMISEDKKKEYDEFFFDSLSEATESDNILNLIEEKKKEEEKIVEEKKEETIEIKEEKKDYAFQETTDESNMIIFPNEYDPSMVSYEESESKKYQKKINKNYLPKTIEELYTINPDYKYDSNNILINGNVSINDNLGEQVFFKAYNFFKSNKIKISRILFEKLVYYNFRTTESYYYIGLCCFLEKEYLKAIDYIRKAIYLGDKKNFDQKVLSDYSYQVGNIYLKINDYISSIESYEDAIKRNNVSYKSYNKLGIVFYKIGNIEKALDSWKTGMDGGDENCMKNYKWLINKK